MQTVLLKRGLAGFWSRFARKAPEAEQSLPSLDTWEGLEKEIKRAHEEWTTARAYFEQVVEKDLIDHAIHWMTAAEKKYVYLMNRARRLEEEEGARRASG